MDAVHDSLIRKYVIFGNDLKIHMEDIMEKQVLMGQRIY